MFCSVLRAGKEHGRLACQQPHATASQLAGTLQALQVSMGLLQSTVDKLHVDKLLTKHALEGSKQQPYLQQAAHRPAQMPANHAQSIYLQ
jgi:hypothetical protein